MTNRCHHSSGLLSRVACNGRFDFCDHKCYRWLSDLCLHCSGWEATIARFSWKSEERDSLWSDIYREAAALACQPDLSLKPWFSINAKLTSLWATRISEQQLNPRFPQWIMVGRELQNPALPWSELCYTKSISPILQEKDIIYSSAAGAIQGQCIELVSGSPLFFFGSCFITPQQAKIFLFNPWTAVIFAVSISGALVSVLAEYWYQRGREFINVSVFCLF